MIIGRIARDEFGSKITGRAGADLNGTLLLIFLLPLMLLLMLGMHQSGQGTARLYALVAIVFGIGLPFTVWFNFKARKEADPLVRFVRQTVGSSAGQVSKPSRGREFDSKPVAAARMNVDGIEVEHPPSETALNDALAGLEPGGFLILSFGPETYMQTALEYDRFILERREGNDFAHWRRKEPLELRDVVEAMCDYLNGKTKIDQAKWERIAM